MAGLLAWLDTIPPREQLLHATGRLHEMSLQDARTGTFKIKLAAGGTLHTFEFANAHRRVAQLSPRANPERRDIDRVVTAAVAYYAFGRGKKVVDVTVGQEHVLSYDDVTKLAAEKEVKDRGSA